MILMAELSGKLGDVTFSSGDDSVKSWTISYTGDVLETTDFDDSTGGRSYIAGLTGWSGSYDCNYSTGNTRVPNNTGTAYFRTSTGVSGVWSGTIFITGMDVSTPVDGIITQSYTFQGSGVLSASS